MSDSHPRLLVATEFPPNASGGGPAVVRQMLKGWPTERLFWWSCLPERDERFGQKTAALQTATIPPRLYPHQRWAAQKSWLLENVWTAWAARHFRKTLDLFRPEVVWVIPQSWAVPPLGRALSSGNVRFHVTVQDYCDTRARVERFGAARCRRMMSLAERLYAAATTRDATSHPMIADLRARTGCDAAQMLHAGLEEDDFAWLAKRPGSSHSEIRIAYAGTVIAEKAFAAFVTALGRIRQQLPAVVSLEFFGNDLYRRRTWFDASWMHERGNLAEPALTRALRECAWGFSPMRLDNADPRGNRFSFPTKFISYLAAGLPVITLGELESAVMKMARTYDVGLSTSEGDPHRLSLQLLSVLADPDAWRRYRAGIRLCASAEFDAHRMRSVLHECFLRYSQVTRSSPHSAS